MAVTAVSTAGGSTANAYATTTEAATYLAGRLDTAQWNSLNADQQNRALIQAAVLLDRLPLIGVTHDDSENDLHFPTANCENEDTGALFVPTEIRDANIELALAYAQAVSGAVGSLASARAQGVQSMSEGKLSVTFAAAGSSSAASMAQTVLSLSPAARDLLKTRTVYNDYRGWLVTSATRRLSL